MLSRSKFVILIACIFMPLTSLNTSAHSWYTGKENPVTHKSCCGGFDCFPVEDKAIKFENHGYRWLDAPNPEHGWIPEDQVQISQDSKYHVCWWGGKLQCLFLPASV